MRIFIAVPLDEPVRDVLCGAVEALRALYPGGRFPPRENLHLTLAFLGELPPERLPAVREAMAVEARPFPLAVEGLGRFRRREGDLVFARVAPGEALLALQQALCGRLRARGFRLEERPYTPHLTLGRQVRLEEALWANLSPLAPPLEMTADRMQLMLSRHVDGRLCYTPLYETLF